MSGNTNSGRQKKETKTNSKSNIKIEPPEYMTGIALGYWNKVTNILLDRQTYSDADYEALEMLTTLYGQWRTIQGIISDKGMTYETKTDRGAFVIRENPAVKTMLSIVKQLDTYQRKFGLTPLDRAAIKTTPKAKKSIRDKY